MTTEFNNIYGPAFDEIMPPIFGDTMSYIKFGETGFDISAMSSELSTDQKLEFGMSLTSTIREYIIDVEELTLSGTEFEPGRNDQIQETINGVATLFEVTAQGDAPSWEYTDSDRNYYRIRAVEIYGS